MNQKTKKISWITGLINLIFVCLVFFDYRLTIGWLVGAFLAYFIFVFNWSFGKWVLKNFKKGFLITFIKSWLLLIFFSLILLLVILINKKINHIGWLEKNLIIVWGPINIFTFISGWTFTNFERVLTKIYE